MELLTDELRAKLLANGKANAAKLADPETLVIEYRDEWGTTLTYRMAGEPSANPNATN